MLFWVDRKLGWLPSRAINRLTGGEKGSSLCGRMYLYRKHINSHNKVVNFAIAIIDSVETNHCKKSARIWARSTQTGDTLQPKDWISLTSRQVGSDKFGL